MRWQLNLLSGNSSDTPEVCSVQAYTDQPHLCARDDLGSCYEHNAVHGCTDSIIRNGSPDSRSQTRMVWSSAQRLDPVGRPPGTAARQVSAVYRMGPNASPGTLLHRLTHHAPHPGDEPRQLHLKQRRKRSSQPGAEPRTVMPRISKQSLGITRLRLA